MPVAQRTPQTSPLTRTGTDCCSGWVRMQDGQLAAAAADAAATADATLHRRDALWAAALQTAIARRSGDSGAVQKYWYAAMEVLAEYSMDLFSLLPLGELWVAAARMRQVDRLQHTLDGGVRAARIAGQSGVVVGAVALGGRARRNPRQFSGSGCAAWSGVDGRRRTTAHSRRRLPPQAAPGCGCWPITSTSTR